MFDELVDHLEAVEDVTKKLIPTRAFGFALACVERQWAVYEKASIGKPWDVMRIRAALDQAWQCVIYGETLPPDFIQQCYSACPADDFPNDASVAAAHLISHSGIDLLSAVRDGASVYCHFPAARNIDILEMLCDESDLGEELKLLVDNEVEKQKHDLETLQVSDRIQGIRDASIGKDLFDGHWFPG